VTDLTTQADINAKVFKRLEAIDIRHWAEIGGKPEDVNVYFFKRDSNKTKAQLYNGGKGGANNQVVCERCKKKGHKARDCRSKAPVANRNPGQPSSKVTVKCFNCNKLGHKAADCRSKQRSQKRGRENENKDPNSKKKKYRANSHSKDSKANVARLRDNEENELYADNADEEEMVDQDTTIPGDDENIRLHVTVLQSSQSNGDHDPKKVGCLIYIG
jgi:hypothetical protein